MTTYDTNALTAQAAAQFDGTAVGVAAVQAICRDARSDPTEQRVMKVPVGGSHGQVRTMYVGDWVMSLATGEFIVLPNTTFVALFTTTP